MEQDVYVMAVDDDVILESPYGSIVAMTTDSNREAYLKASNLTLLVTDADEGEVQCEECEGEGVRRDHVRTQRLRACVKVW